MVIDLRDRRKALGVSLDKLAAALGPGFSRARLSIAERGLIELSEAEQGIVLVAIERIGGLRSEVRSVVRLCEQLERETVASLARAAHA